MLDALGIAVEITTMPVEVEHPVPFDLAQTRFSGRPASVRECSARWMGLEADQEGHEVGFWPGNSKLPQPAFGAFTYPKPPGCREAPIQPNMERGCESRIACYAEVTSALADR